MREKNNDFTAACAFYLTGYLLLAVIRAGGYLGWFSGSAWEYLGTILIQVGIMFILPTLAFYIYKKRTRPRTEFGMTFSQFADMQKNKDERGILQKWRFGKISAGIVGISAVLGVLLFFFNMFVSSFFNNILALLGYRHMSGGGDPEFFYLGNWGVIVSLLMGAVLPGLCEETMHRGMLLHSFTDRIGILRAVMLSSILFGMFHMNVVQVFYCMVLGYFMAMAVVSTRSIWAGVIIHFMNNGIAAYMSYASHPKNMWFLGDFFEHFNAFFGEGVLGLILYYLLWFGIYVAVVQIFKYFARKNFLADQAERLSKGIEPMREPLPHIKGMNAVKYYVAIGSPAPQARFLSELRPIEKALLYGIIFMGVVINGMSLVWGFL